MLFRICISALLMNVIPGPAFAYLEPGSLSMVINIIIAGIVGAAVSVKIYWDKIRAWVMKIISSSKNNYH